MSNQNKKQESSYEGTTIIGIVAENGVVIAGDKQISGHVKKMKGEKIFKIHPKCVLGISGAVSHCQVNAEMCQKEIKKYEFRRGRIMSVDDVFDTVTNIARKPLFSSTLLVAYDGEKGYLTEYDMSGSYIHSHNFTSIGSGSMIAKGSLEEQYENDLTVEDAKQVAINSLKTTNQHGIYTGIGIDIATITSDGVEIEENIQEL